MKAREIREPTKYERRAYESIVKGKKNYGVYHKTCFHLHTPVSYDYRLLNDWEVEDYTHVSAQDVLNICVERHVIIDTVTLDDIKLEGALKCFDDKNSYYLFCC